MPPQRGEDLPQANPRGKVPFPLTEWPLQGAIPFSLRRFRPAAGFYAVPSCRGHLSSTYFSLCAGAQRKILTCVNTGAARLSSDVLLSYHRNRLRLLLSNGAA